MPDDIVLKWNGSGFMDGVPARDLTADEVAKYGGHEALLKSGCYEEPLKSAAAKKPTQTKESE